MIANQVETVYDYMIGCPTNAQQIEVVEFGPYTPRRIRCVLDAHTFFVEETPIVHDVRVVMDMPYVQ